MHAPDGPASPGTLAPLRGVPFTKMSGSGNDFVVFDGRVVPAATFADPAVVRALCDRHHGVGADGVVVLTAADSPGHPVALRYYNSDGSLGELCGNATLCSTAQAVRLGIAEPASVRLVTDAGLVRARIGPDGPEIDVAPVRDVRPSMPALDDASDACPGPVRGGFAVVGVPHVVRLFRGDLPGGPAAALDALERVAIDAEGRHFREHPAVGPAGANVNWVAFDPVDARWAYRTYERGVEGETQACGTGAIAIAILLTAWGVAESPVRLRTRSGRALTVTLERRPAEEPNARTGGQTGLVPTVSGATAPEWQPSLQGEGRVVFDGVIR